MGKPNIHEWQKLPVSLSELCINTTLRCGQSFRWRKSDDGVWSMALHGRILSLYQDPECLYYRATFPSVSRAPPTPPASTTADHEHTDNTPALVQHYLNLEPNLTQLYTQWSASDANFAKKAPKFTGVRILKQDAWEALVGFICSSNNNIARIGQMVDKLCRRYGPPLGDLDGAAYHDLPGPAALVGPGVEQTLRDLGFGYRARYLHQTACAVAAKPPGWLDGLRNPEAPVLGGAGRSAGEWTPRGREGYRAAHEALLALQGVGPKVADCVCLMGLGWGEAVPVDTHVWQIAVRDYRFGKGKHSSLTRATYDAVGDKFRTLWGKEAGWAHSVLFTADLRAFAERLVAKVETKEEETVVKKEEETVVKKEEETDVKKEEEGDGEETLVTVKKEVKATKKRVKVESEDEAKTVVEVQSTLRRTKRRKV